MQYAEHLPNPRRMLVPVVALVIGAAAATGTYALLDEEQVALQPPKIIVADTPAQPGEGVSAKNEAATAAAIGTGAAVTGSEGVNAKNEAASAAAIGSGSELRGSKASSSGTESDEALRTDPHGNKSAFPGR